MNRRGHLVGSSQQLHPQLTEQPYLLSLFRVDCKNYANTQSSIRDGEPNARALRGGLFRRGIFFRAD